MTDGSDYGSYVRDRSGSAPSSDLASIRFKQGLCDGHDLRPDTSLLTEGHIIKFLEKQGVDVRVERQREDLIYLNVSGLGTASPVRMRVAVLKNADEAGLELHQAVLQHGIGSWGVHRSNLAVLGAIGSIDDDLVFAAKSKLACWGVFTVAGRDDTFVVPGGYFEL
ncbi:MAG: hypothetical protein ACOY0T_09610 [Myxococcota bacterium]